MYYYTLNLVLSNPNTEKHFDFREHQDFIEEQILIFNNSKKRNPKAISNFLITSNIINLELESAIELEMPIKAIRTFTQTLLQHERFRQAAYKKTLFKVSDEPIMKRPAPELADNENELTNLSADHGKGDDPMELKIIEWNINQKSGLHCKEIPPFVGEEIKKQNADVVVLTEFYKAENWVNFISDTFSEYNVFYTMNPKNQNDVLIAIKSIHKVTHIAYLYSEYGNYNPNLLRVDIIADGKLLTVIGTRIRVQDSGGSEERRFRQEQFLKLLKQIPEDRLKQIPEDRRVIILGDMNISEGYNGPEWHYEKIYQNTIKKRSLVLCIPKEGNSPIGSKWKLDHLIISNGITLEGEPQYIEDVLWPQGENYPDHAILTATIKIEDKKEK